MNRHYGCHNSTVLFYWSAEWQIKQKKSFQIIFYILFDLIENYEIGSYFTVHIVALAIFNNHI